MTISTLLMILSLAAGPGSSPATSCDIPIGDGEPEYHCFINGVWYNPCPHNGTPWDPQPPPPTEPPD